MKANLTEKTTAMDKQMKEDINTIIQQLTTIEFNQKKEEKELNERINGLESTLDETDTTLLETKEKL